MENMIIIAIVAVLVIIGLRSTRKHMKGQGECCGGGSSAVVVPEKKLDKVIGTKTVIVDGMTCDHCKGWVEKAVNNIDGASCKVNLKKNEAVVSMEREVSDEEIRAAIKGAGYRVVEIR